MILDRHRISGIVKYQIVPLWIQIISYCVEAVLKFRCKVRLGTFRISGDSGTGCTKKSVQLNFNILLISYILNTGQTKTLFCLSLLFQNLPTVCHRGVAWSRCVPDCVLDFNRFRGWGHTLLPSLAFSNVYFFSAFLTCALFWALLFCLAFFLSALEFISHPTQFYHLRIVALFYQALCYNQTVLI